MILFFELFRYLLIFFNTVILFLISYIILFISCVTVFIYLPRLCSLFFSCFYFSDSSCSFSSKISFHIPLHLGISLPAVKHDDDVICESNGCLHRKNASKRKRFWHLRMLRRFYFTRLGRINAV